MKQLAIVTALALGLCVAAPTVAAQPTRPAPVQLADDDEVQQARANVLVIHADNSGKGIDPRLEHLKQLTEGPFKAYNSYWLIEEKSLDLTKGEATTAELPDKGKLKLALKGVEKPEKDGDKPRYVVKASITKPNGKKFLRGLEVNAAEGDIFFIAGQKYRGGILVLGISLHKR